MDEATRAAVFAARARAKAQMNPQQAGFLEWLEEALPALVASLGPSLAAGYSPQVMFLAAFPTPDESGVQRLTLGAQMNMDPDDTEVVCELLQMALGHFSGIQPGVVIHESATSWPGGAR